MLRIFFIKCQNYSRKLRIRNIGTCIFTIKILCNFDIDKSTGRKSHFRIAFPIYKVFLIHYVKYKIEEYIYNKNNLN